MLLLWTLRIPRTGPWRPPPLSLEPLAVSCVQRTAGVAAPAVWPPAGCRAPFPETHTSGLERTHPVTSVRFEEEKKSQVKLCRRGTRGPRGPSRFFLGFWVFLFLWLRRLWERRVGTVRKVLLKRTEERFFLKRGGCQPQTTRTGSGRDMAVSSPLFCSPWGYRRTSAPAPPPQKKNHL